MTCYRRSVRLMVLLLWMALLTAACALPSWRIPPTPLPATVFTPETFTRRPEPHPAWTTYTNANYVADMAFDGEGNLWTGGPGGVVKWNLADGSSTKYTTQDGLVGNGVTAIAVGPDGALWFGTEEGLSRYDGREWLNVVYPPRHVHCRGAGQRAVGWHPRPHFSLRRLD